MRAMRAPSNSSVLYSACTHQVLSTPSMTFTLRSRSRRIGFNNIWRGGQLAELSGLDCCPEGRKHDLKNWIIAQAASRPDRIHDQIEWSILMRHRVQ